MSDDRDRIGVRTGVVLRSIVAGYGELSAATRALLIIGAVELGTPAQLLQEDIAVLIGATLAPDVRKRLLSLLNSGSTSVEQEDQGAPLLQAAIEEEQPADPFGDLGFEV